MIKQNTFPLDLQLFAEGDPAGGTVQTDPINNPTLNNPAPQINIDYDELGNAITKGVGQKENAILKDYFKRQGLSEEEAQQAMTTFKKTKTEEAKKKEAAYQDIVNQNKSLKEQAVNGDITACALGLGVSGEKAPFLLKLIEREKFMNEDGTTDSEKMKTELENILKVFPDLKIAVEDNKGFQAQRKVGSDGKQGQQQIDEEFAQWKKEAGLQ